MTIEILGALAVFALVTSATPGPNNVMLLASGANFGFKKTIPHLFGISIGHAVMITALGSGLLPIFSEYPTIMVVIKVICIAYLIFLAWKIATTTTEAVEGKDKGKPLNFFQAALFQWVNPKAWAMALSAISVYSPSQNFETILLVAIIFGLINLPSCSMWIIFGTQLKIVLTNSLRLRSFNVLMAVLLMGSLYPVLW